MGKIYRLKSEFNACLFTIRINDIPIFKQVKNFPSTSKTTISEWLFNGSNQLTVQISFNDEIVYGIDTHMHLVVYEIDTADSDELYPLLITEILLPQFIENTLPPAFYEKSFIVKNVPITSAFSKGRILKPNKEIFDTILKKYHIIESYLLKKDLDGYFLYTNEKEKEYAKLYFEDKDQRIRENKAIIEHEYDEPNNKLFKLQEKYLRLHIYNYGKLACIEDIEGNHCLFFYNSKTNDVTFIPIYMYFDVDRDDFIVIR